MRGDAGPPAFYFALRSAKEAEIFIESLSTPIKRILKPMRILFVHNNFPGQYARIIRHLKDKPGFDLLSASLATNTQPAPIRRIGYSEHRAPRKDIHPALTYTEKCVIRAQAAYKALMPVKQKGWKPDIILAHSGFGDGMFMKDLWPDAKYLPYFEWFYHAYGSDASFLDHGKQKTPDQEFRIRLKNTAILQDLAAMDWGQCPTVFQRDQFPEQFRGRITALHDGVDTDYFAPDPDAALTIGEHTFRKGDPVVSYIARGMEPYRGFPQFVEALSILQCQNKDVHAVIIGEDKAAYGAKRQDGKSHKDWALEQFPLDMTRTHFMGRQPLKTLKKLQQVTAAHVYLTVPFVLSWSMMEAMSTGALIVGSDTDPVREMVTDGENGLLVPFWEPARLAEALGCVVADPGAYEPMRRAARQLIVDSYPMNGLTSRYQDLIETVADGRLPLPDFAENPSGAVNHHDHGEHALHAAPDAAPV